MQDSPPTQNVALTPRSVNARPAVPAFFLDPRLYRAFPPARRAQLVAIYNLLLAFGRNESRTVLATQNELAELLAISSRQVGRLEAELEELGAVRSLRDLPGLRGGRALELVTIVDWTPSELWRGPRSSREEPLPAILDNSPGADILSTHGGHMVHPQARNAPSLPRARQSTNELMNVTRGDDRARGASSPIPPQAQARRMFAFLCREAGVSGRRWRDAFPVLEDLVRVLGPDRAWNEVERIAHASRSAVNPGGYAFACLFPDGRPDARGLALRSVEPHDNPGPLFERLPENQAQSPDAPAPRERKRPGPTPRTGKARTRPARS